MNKILVGVAFVFAALCSQASYLYWQVSDGDLPDGVEGNWADLYVTRNGESTWIQKAQIGNQSSIDVASYSDGSYSFYVEIINYANGVSTVTGTSSDNPTAYSELVAKNAIVSSPMETPQFAAWHGGKLAAAPEPTSGFLMMVGLALLGLKRRKA